MVGGIGYAQMDDPRNAGRLAGAEEGEGVFNGRLKRRPSARETNPIGVVKDSGSLETLGESVRVIEVVGRDTHLAAKRVRPTRVPRQGPDARSHCQQTAGDKVSSKAECSGDYVQGLDVASLLRPITPSGATPFPTAPPAPSRSSAVMTGTCRGNRAPRGADEESTAHSFTGGGTPRV